MASKYHPCGHSVWFPEIRSGSEDPAEFFDGHRPEVVLTVCPACGVVLEESDLQDHWDVLEFDVH